MSQAARRQLEMLSLAHHVIHAMGELQEHEDLSRLDDARTALQAFIDALERRGAAHDVQLAGSLRGRLVERIEPAIAALEGRRHQA